MGHYKVLFGLSGWTLRRFLFSAVCVTFLFYFTYVVTCSAVTLFRLLSVISYFGVGIRRVSSSGLVFNIFAMFHAEHPLRPFLTIHPEGTSFPFQSSRLC